MTDKKTGELPLRLEYLKRIFLVGMVADTEDFDCKEILGGMVIGITWEGNR